MRKIEDNIRDEVAVSERRVATMTDEEYAWYANTKWLIQHLDEVRRGIVCLCGAATWQHSKCFSCGRRNPN